MQVLCYHKKSQNFDTKLTITAHEIHQEVSYESLQIQTSRIFYPQKCTTPQPQQEPRKQAQTSAR
ncbi:hypothetical protein Hanom_Chr00s000001g01593501 [Helianthus anomalus]